MCVYMYKYIYVCVRWLGCELGVLAAQGVGCVAFVRQRSEPPAFVTSWFQLTHNGLLHIKKCAHSCAHSCARSFFSCRAGQGLLQPERGSGGVAAGGGPAMLRGAHAAAVRQVSVCILLRCSCGFRVGMESGFWVMMGGGHVQGSACCCCTTGQSVGTP